MTHKLQFNQNDNYASIPLYSAPQGLKALISLQAAGNMSYQLKEQIPDRNKFIKSLGIKEDAFFYQKQKHTHIVTTLQGLGKPQDFCNIEADGLVSLSREAILSVTIADCLPIFLYHKEQAVFSLVHSGWKGTGIASHALENMLRHTKSDAKDIAVTIGPGIGACCYKVDENRAHDFQKKYGLQVAKKQKNGYYLDLREANISLLRTKGVENFTIIEDCTSCTPALHSYRRQGPDEFKLMMAVMGYF